LEQERRQLAAQRGRDPIIAQAIGAIGVTVACLLPLLLAGYVLYTVNRASPEDDSQAVSDVLIGEMVSSAPELLPAPAAMPQLECTKHLSPSMPRLVTLLRTISRGHSSPGARRS
jgi:hypothetical protein